MSEIKVDNSNHTIKSAERAALERLAFLWPGHTGCDFAHTPLESLESLIEDAIIHDQLIISELRQIHNTLRMQASLQRYYIKRPCMRFDNDSGYWVDDGRHRGPLVRHRNFFGEVWYLRPDEWKRLHYRRQQLLNTLGFFDPLYP